MAGKQILGDDPFATGDDKEAPPPVEVAAEVKAKGKKLNGDKATLADSVAPDATVEHGPPPPVQETYTPVETRPPSEYVREHVYLTTQPVEEPHKPEYFSQMLDQYGEMVSHILFASDYPHWDSDNPDMALPPSLPKPVQAAIYYENARQLYGL